MHSRRRVAPSVIGLGLGLACLLSLTSRAGAEPDVFGLGDGHAGTLTVATANTVVNAYAQVLAPVAPGDTAVSVSTTTGFAAGDLVMVIQTTGVVPSPSSGAPGPYDLRSDPVGRWELGRL